MTTDDVLKHYGTIADVRKALKISHQVWYQWRRGGIPVGRQWWIHAKTGLQADEWE